LAIAFPKIANLEIGLAMGILPQWNGQNDPSNGTTAPSELAFGQTLVCAKFLQNTNPLCDMAHNAP
jgi:hypothetical protein